MSETAKIIFLHGASSSGKSTTARGLQAALDEPFWHISIDHLRDAGVLPTARFKSGAFSWPEARPRFFTGFHRSLAAYASAGNNLILEHILDNENFLPELVELLEPFDVFFVGIHCALPTLVEREKTRGDRSPGSAEQDFHAIHRGLRYDHEIQSEDGLESNVARVIDAWKARQKPSAFALIGAARV